MSARATTEDSQLQKLKELARQGDVKAIAYFLNEAFQPDGITVKVALKDGCLKVLLESREISEAVALAPYLCEAIKAIEVESVQTLKVFGRQTGKESPEWSQEYDLNLPAPGIEDWEEKLPVPHSPTLCPRCQSDQVEMGKKGFQFGMAMVGFMTLGLIGLASGISTDDEYVFSCLKCKHQWQPDLSELSLLKPPEPLNPELLALCEAQDESTDCIDQTAPILEWIDTASASDLAIVLHAIADRLAIR